VVSILIDNDLLLRSWTAEDAAALFRAVEENRAHLQPWLPWVSRTERVDNIATFIQHSMAVATTGEAIYLGLFYQGRVIGGAGLHDCNPQVRSASVGYWIAKEFEGRGVIKRSLARLLDFAFDTLGLQRLELRCAASNERSAALARRLGFVEEGMLRRGHWRETGVEDLVVMGLLKEEWSSRP